MTTELDLHRAWIALIAAELDGDSERAALILRRDDDPDFVYNVLIHAARSLASHARLDPDAHKEMRAEMGAALYNLAQEPDS